MSRKSLPTQHAEVSPNIIRAWFDTVLNPLLYGLRIEADVLSQGNLTWRFQAWSPVSLVPVRSLLMDVVQDNLEQFLSLHPACLTPIEEHDVALESVVEACRALQRALTTNEEIRTTIERLIPVAERAGIAVAFHHDRLAVIAEYVINNIERLPSYYAMAAFWNEHSAEFLKLRNNPEIQPSSEVLIRAVRRFSQAVDRLIGALKEVRNNLSLSAGVPIVERLAL